LVHEVAIEEGAAMKRMNGKPAFVALALLDCLAAALAGSEPTTPFSIVEVIFVLDATGSIGGLIEGAKTKIWSIVNIIVAAQIASEGRVGLIFYRDRGDQHTTHRYDRDDDLHTMFCNMQSFRAAGGGDGPESVNQALREVVHLMSWTPRPDALKIVSITRDLTVVTNDLAIALVLEAAGGVRVLFMGGLVRRNYHCTMVHGATGRDILAGLSVDKAFMACNSFSVEKGASTPDINQAETKKLMRSIAAKVIMLFDTSKKGRTSFALFAPLETIDTIVTDAIDAEDRARLEENGIDVIVAG
jgi:hypothetical protein